MKKLIRQVATTLTLLSSITAILAVSFTGSTSTYAGGLSDSISCRKSLKPVSSGGFAREQLAAMARCGSTNTPSNTSSIQPLKSSLSTNLTSTSNDCVIPPAQTTGGSARLHLTALTKCNSRR